MDSGYELAELATGLLVGCGGWTLERPGTRTVEPRLGHVRVFDCYSSLNAEKFYRALDFVRVREMDIELRPPVVLRGVFMRRNIGED